MKRYGLIGYPLTHSLSQQYFTNKFIEEIYLLAVLAKSAGQKKIPVFILPSKNLPKTNEKHLDFWKKLFVLNAFFEKNGKLPNYSIDTFGNYILKD